MNLEQYRHSPSGTLKACTAGGAEYFAFVPRVLPPVLAFDAELVLWLDRASGALGELAGIGRTMVNPHLLINPFLVREAVVSSRIEGTQADVADVFAYQAAQSGASGVQAHSEDTLEVANYVNAINRGIELLRQNKRVDINLMNQVHTTLLSGVRNTKGKPGAFRAVQNWIGQSGSTVQQASYVPPPAAEMREVMRDLERFIESDKTLPPLIRIALIHYQFEAIHPYTDGNGRIGRVLNMLMMLAWELLPLPLLYLSAYFEGRRDEYFERLHAVSERGAWNEWLVFFLKGVTQQARDTLHYAKRLQDLQNKWRELAVQHTKSPNSVKVVEQLFITPMITIPRVQRIIQQAHPTAQRIVKRMVEAGILEEREAKGVTRRFEAAEILRITSPDAQSNVHIRARRPNPKPAPKPARRG